MKYIITTLVFGALMLIPGDLPGFVRPPYHPAPRPVPRPAPIHTPAYVAPRPVAPIYHAPVRTPVTTLPVRPITPVHPIVRPPVTVQPVRPVQPIVRPPVVVNRPGVVNRPVVINRVTGVNRGIYINRGTSYYRPGYAYYHPFYNGWHHGYWGGWYRRPWLWFGGGVAAGWLWGSTPNVVYANPYWQAPAVYAYDYAQPIPVPDPTQMPADPNAITDPYGQLQTNAAPPTPPDDPNAAAAAKLLDDVRQAFLASDYNNALRLIDQAIPSSPKDTTLHEFRALILFAQRRYQDAAATIYAVLAVGPGWDWDTLSSFYRDPDIYTTQLRALEDYTRTNPKDAASRFLLAYHYLTANHRDDAARVLRNVVALQPNDQLAAYLLQMLENKGPPNNPPPGQ